MKRLLPPRSFGKPPSAAHIPQSFTPKLRPKPTHSCHRYDKGRAVIGKTLTLPRNQGSISPKSAASGRAAATVGWRLFQAHSRAVAWPAQSCAPSEVKPCVRATAAVSPQTSKRRPLGAVNVCRCRSRQRRGAIVDFWDRFAPAERHDVAIDATRKNLEWNGSSAGRQAIRNRHCARSLAAGDTAGFIDGGSRQAARGRHAVRIAPAIRRSTPVSYCWSTSSPTPCLPPPWRSASPVVRCGPKAAAPTSRRSGRPSRSGARPLRRPRRRRGQWPASPDARSGLRR